MTARALAMTLEGEAPHLAALPLTFEAVYDEWLDFVWRSMRRLGVQDAALDDAVQDVFIVVHRRLGDFHGRSTLKTWLFGIALRVASDYRRSAARRPTEPITGELHDASASPFETLTQRRALAALDAMLACLDEDKRAVFVMMDIEEMSAVEAAEALGIKTNTAYSRLRLARAEIEAMVAARGGVR
jgi:RNA polymerase sigma-70 factor (ECF subfamily)